VQVIYHTWCYGPQVTAASDQFDREQAHANWGENFLWNRLPGVDLPTEPRPVVPMEVITQLDARRIRAALPEGMMGGAYARPDDDMQVIWDAGVAEVRQVIETGWLT
jgi:creatinine amidohydrolase